MKEKTDNRTKANLAVDALYNSSSYVGFKMKLDILGIDLYNITVLRSVWSRIPLNWQKEFDEDVKDNLNSPKLIRCAINTIKDSLYGCGNSFSFGTFIANKWIERYERDIRKGKRRTKLGKG